MTGIMSDKYIFEEPYLYDLAFSYDIKQEINFISSILGKSERILIPACGTGRYALKLGELGYNIDAFDYSSQMVSYANDFKAHDLISYYQDDLTEMKLTLSKDNRYQSVLLLNNALRYIHDYKQIKNHFEISNNLLLDNGKYLVEAGFNDSPEIIGETNKWKISLDSEDSECKSKSVIASWTAIDYDPVFTKDFAALKYYEDGKLVKVATEIQKQLIWKFEMFLELVFETGFELEAIYMAHTFHEISSNHAKQDNIRLYVLLRKKICE